MPLQPDSYFGMSTTVGRAIARRVADLGTDLKIETQQAANTARGQKERNELTRKVILTAMIELVRLATMLNATGHGVRIDSLDWINGMAHDTVEQMFRDMRMQADLIRREEKRQ